MQDFLPFLGVGSSEHSELGSNGSREMRGRRNLVKKLMVGSKKNTQCMELKALNILDGLDQMKFYHRI